MRIENTSQTAARPTVDRGLWTVDKKTAVTVLLVLLFALGGCGQRSAERETDAYAASDNIRYATGFKVSKIGHAKRVEVIRPFQGAESGFTYLLVPRGEVPPENAPDVRVIYTPLESIVCTSTTHIPLLDYLGETDKLVGFPTTDYISSKKMRARIDAGMVTELGIDKQLNMERLAMLRPDAVMGYSMNSDYGQFRKIESMGIPVIINAEYLEHHPLGRAEWIKFMALFFDREARADSVFAAIEKDYLSTQALLDQDVYRPTVLSGIVYGDAWFLPGGGNYAARLFADAGCHYLWADTRSTGYLELSFESVYAKALNVDLWIGTGPYKSLDELAAADKRYTQFKAFKEKQVFMYDARIGATGGNEFLELGYLRPDLILQDLVKIAHPTLLPDYQLFFHRRLN